MKAGHISNTYGEFGGRGWGGGGGVVVAGGMTGGGGGGRKGGEGTFKKKEGLP